MSRFIVYSICHVDTGRLYVGSTRHYQKRCSTHRRHLDRGNHINPKLQFGWSKYGAAAFEFAIIEEVEKEEDLLLREQFWIDHFDPHYNIAKIAGAPMAGRSHSQESKQAISAYHLGRKKPEGMGEKLSLSLQGHSVSAEVREKLRQFRTGKPRGFPETQKNIDALIKRRAKPFSIMSPEGEIISGLNLRAFCTKHDLDYFGLHRVATGRQKQI